MNLRALAHTLALSTCIAVGCDAPPDVLASDVAPRDYPVYEPDDYAQLPCTYELPIVWNDDYATPAPMCAMKMAVQYDALIPDCAYGSPQHCLELAVHLAQQIKCFELAVKNGG